MNNYSLLRDPAPIPRRLPKPSAPSSTEANKAAQKAREEDEKKRRKKKKAK